MEPEFSSSLEYTPTWIVAIVCSIIVLVSLCAERALHHLGKIHHVRGFISLLFVVLFLIQFLVNKDQDQLYEALNKLKEELMLLGFISLLLTVSQGLISRICIPTHLASFMLPCKLTHSANGPEHYSLLDANNRRRLLSEGTNSEHCLKKGKVPLLSLEALHQLHIFIFVLAIVHVIFCVTTMFLGGARIRQWKPWEDSIKEEISKSRKDPTTANSTHAQDSHESFKQRAGGYWRKAAIVSWMISFFKQFYGSVTKSDYIALRQGFIKEHCPTYTDFDFYEYMVRTLEVDFKKVVGISWYLWLFVVVFLLLNLEGWHTYFWLSFLPLILLLFVGAKLEHVIMRLAQQAVEGKIKIDDREAVRVKPSDEHFWFGRPAIVLQLIHFILFQNSFEIGFFFWVWCTYGFDSCIMEKVGYIVTRLVMGAIVQVLCSYSTLPLYALVTQMGSAFKEGIFDENMDSAIRTWAGNPRKSKKKTGSRAITTEVSTRSSQTLELATVLVIEETTTTTELPSVTQPPFPST